MTRDQLPQPAQDFVWAFAPNADSLAMLYGGHLYLVGSALTSEHPGDMDVRVCLSREDWVRLFGDDQTIKEGATQTVQWWAWTRECLKISRRMTRRYQNRWRIDIQLQREEVFQVHPGAKFQLDRAPDHLLGVGLGEP